MASSLFILVGTLWEFGPRCVHFTVPFRKKRSTLLPKGTDLHIQQHIYQKDLNLCLPLYYYAKVIVELEQTQTRSNCVIVLMIKPSSTFKFKCVFGFNECLWAIFSLLNFENFWFYIRDLVLWLLVLWQRWLHVHK